MKYVLLPMLVLLQFACFGQKAVSGKYFRGDSFNGVSIQLKKNDSCIYFVYSDIMGQKTFHTTYSIRKNKIHINIQPPPDTQKFSTVYKGDNVAHRTIDITDCQRMPDIGATVTLNGKIKLPVDTAGLVMVPEGLILHSIKINAIDIRDTTITPINPERGNIEIEIPTKSYYDVRYNSILKDWLIKSYRLYSINKGKVSSKFFLKRVA